MPSQISIIAKPNPVTQILMKDYNLRLTLNIDSENAHSRIWRFPNYVGMKVGMQSCKGKIKWSDDEGSHEVDLLGTGSIWNMRKF